MENLQTRLGAFANDGFVLEESEDDILIYYKDLMLAAMPRLEATQRKIEQICVRFMRGLASQEGAV